MEGTVLVAYATKHGSTREVAEAVAARLREHGLHVELESANTTRELDGIEAVVLGGSLYMGRWHPDARRFLKRNRAQLAETPLAVFGMGPLTTEDKDVASARQQLEHALRKTPELEPRTVAIFGGVVDPDKLSFPFNHMPASDARDWDEIQRWTDLFALSEGLVQARALVRCEPTC